MGRLSPATPCSAIVGDPNGDLAYPAGWWRAKSHRGMYLDTNGRWDNPLVTALARPIAPQVKKA